MEKIDLKLNEDYKVTWEDILGIPGVIPRITVINGDYKGLSFILESSKVERRSDEPDVNQFIYDYKLASYPDSKKDDSNYRLTEDDKSYILQLILNYITEAQEYDRYHTIWEK